MIRAAHVSDLHYCDRYLEWVDRAMHAAVEEAIAWKADVGILSGDSTDTAVNLHSPAVALLVSRVRRLASKMPVFILQGTFSHDRPGCLDIFRHLRTEYPIYVCEKAERIALINGQWETGFEPHHITSASTAPIVICGFPSVNRAEIQAATPDQATSSYVDAQVQAWAPGNLQLRAAGVPTMLVSHGTVNGCVTESKQAMVSQDHEFGAASLFACETDGVALGHIHAHQSWTFRDNQVLSGYEAPGVGRRIAYPGSITKLIYGHAAAVGMLKWELEAGRSDFTLFETPSRALVDITFDGPPDLAQLKQQLEKHRGSFVRLRYSVDEEHRHGIDKEGLDLVLKAAGLAEYKIEPRINPVQRTRSAGISTEVSTAKRLERWCAESKTDPAPLLERLQILEAA